MRETGHGRSFRLQLREAGGAYSIWASLGGGASFGT
jgi:hypothetical protein